MELTAPVRARFDALFGALLGPTQRLQAKFVAFMPVAALVNAAGHIDFVAAQPPNDAPTTQDVLTLLYDGLRSRKAAGGMHAFGVVTDGRHGPSPDTMHDAILVHLEDESGVAITVAVPYTRTATGGFTYEAAAAGAATAVVFTPPVSGP